MPPGTNLTPQQSKFVTIRDLLKSPAAIANLNAALPKHMSADRMVRIALTAINRTPKLLDCTKESIMESLLTASQLGLEPNGRDAYLVPYKNKCQLIPGYMGFVQLAYRSGQVDNVTAKVVFEKDEFQCEFGSKEFLHHIPCRDDDPGKMIAAWAMARFKDGGSKFVVLWPRDVAKRRAASQATSRDDSPWVKYPEAMWAKSAVRELAKWIPQTPELAPLIRAAAIEDKNEGVEQGFIDVESAEADDMPEDGEAPAETKSETVAKKLADKRGASAPKPAEPTADRQAIEMQLVEYIAAFDSVDTPEQVEEIAEKAKADAILDDAARAQVEKWKKTRLAQLAR